MVVAGVIIMVAVSCQRNNMFSEQVTLLSQYCQQFTTKCTKINVPIVWKPVCTRNETQTVCYSDSGCQDWTTTYPWYDIEIHY